jgi:outer membrane protein assembly factor BamB/actin-like ATPase involved in cell morphogenesis
MGEYGLGIDLGTRYTAAAITAGGAVEAVRLGGRRAEIPSAVFRRADGELLIGEAARIRGESEPERRVDDLRARLIAPELELEGLSGPALTAQFLQQVVATAGRGRAGRLGHAVLTHPADWGDDERKALREAARLAGLPDVTLRSEPEAAAARARPGDVVAVYDLGAAFDATVLRRTAEGAEILAAERVTGVDFDRMVFDHVRAGLEFDASGAGADLARLRRECAEAVESLSFDTETEIAVALPGLHTRVRLRRSELEELIGPALAETVAALRRAFETAGVRPADAADVVLAGGSARIPLVGALVSAAIGRSVPPGEQPEMAVAMGAARLSLPGADQAVSVAFPAVPLPFFPAIAPAGTSPHAPDSPAPVRAAVGPEVPARLGATRRRGRIWTYRWPIAVGLAGLLVAAAMTVAAARSRGSAVPPTGPGTPTTATAALLWKTPTGLGSTGPPAAGGDRIVLGTADGYLRGYRRDDGRLSWSVAIGPDARVATGIPGERAYATTSTGRVVAVDTATGEIAWQRSTSTQFDAGPVVGNGRVFAGGRDGVLYAYALTGRHSRWRVWADDRISLTPVLVGTVAVLAAEDGRLYGTDPAGSPMWQPSIGPAAASPVEAAGTACLPLRDGSVRCARAGDGSLLPRIAPAGVRLTAVAGGADLVFAAGSDGSVGAWDPVSGQARWTYRPPSDTGGAGHLLTRTGEIDVAYPAGRVVGLDAGSGAERWQYATGDRLDAAPGGDDDGIFVLGASGLLYALRPPGATVAFGSSPSPATAPATTRTRVPPTHRPFTPPVSASVSGEPSSGVPSDPPPSDPPVSGLPSDEAGAARPG